ncbi:hypothetical protein J2P12_06885, partial [Candidatus Bathyarchaeota archaeon]|nr:hypothetical protein [Candidatus Bathyarchaeota archaeon]
MRQRMSFSVLFLAFLSLAAIVTIPVSLQRSLQATSSSIGIQKADAAGEIVAANDSLQLGRTSLGAADVNCSSGTVGSAYCENSQNSNSAFTSSTPSWTNITSTTGPSPRWGASMAYDAADGYVVLFGGQSIFGYNANLHDTWKFVGGSWTNITTSSGPQADAYAPMTFDAAEGYIVMFSRFGSTWIFQAGAWSLATPCSLPCSPLPSPSPRVAASMTYDPIAGVVVLFGGCCRSPTQDVYGDTWEFQCKLFACGWTNVTSDTGPPARLFASMEYDAADGYTVLFGGTTTFTSTLPFTSLGDTWKFTGGSWTNITATVG